MERRGSLNRDQAGYKKTASRRATGAGRGQRKETADIDDSGIRARMSEHASLLATVQSDERRATLAAQLGKVYGNAYVQRLLDSMAVRSEGTSSQPDDSPGRRTDGVRDTAGSQAAKGAGIELQRQSEEEEELQAKLMRQVEEEEEMQI